MDKHDYPTIEQSRILLPFDDKELMEEALKTQLDFNMLHYRLGASGGHKEALIVQKPGGGGILE